MPADDANANANAVALKLPPFWARKPKAWFAQAEAQFAIRNITVDDTKYYYIVAALDNDIADRVADFIESPPNNNKYDGIKNRLVDAYSLSAYEQACLLIDGQEMGDEKPSAMMAKMMALASAHDRQGDLFRTLFLRRLPEDIRGPLLDSEEKDST